MSELRLPAPLPHQIPVLNDGRRFLLWRAGRRTGKSRCELIAGVAGRGSARQYKGLLQGGAVAWLAPDYKQAQAIWREEIRPRFAGVEGADVSEVEKRVSIPGLGWLQLLSAENIDAARGWKLDAALLDEGAYWDLEYGWNAVIRPALADKQGWAMFGSTTNAGLDGNAMKRVPSYFNLLCERAERGELGPEWGSHHNRTEDNPKIHRAEIAALRAEYPDGSATAAQELDAELGVAGGRYYAVDRTVHVIPRADLPDHLPPWWEYWGAFDWGFAHWSTFGVFCRTKEGAILLLDTTWMRRQQDDELAEGCKRCWSDQGLVASQLVEVYAGHDVRAKPMARGAPGISTQEVFAQHGVYLTLADNDRANGGRVVRRLMAMSDATRSQGFYVVDTPGNRRVVAQLESIVPDPNDVNKPLKVDADADGKGGDDGADMCLGGATAVHTDHGLRRIDSLVGTSGKCLTPLGWQRYIAVRKTRDRALLLRVTLDDGTAIEATADHEILTPTGWRCINDLSIGDAWVRIDPSAGDRAGGAGVSGSAILAERGRVLSATDAVAASGSVRGELRPDSRWTSDPSSGREHGEQRAGEPGTDHAQVTRVAPLDAGARCRVSGALGVGEAQGVGVASFARGPGVALAERQAVHAAARDGDADLPVLRGAVPVHPIVGSLLLERVQVEGTASGRTGQRDGGLSGVRDDVHGESVRSADDVLEDLRTTPARIVRVEPVGFAPTYNMEVETAHCFAVQGGLVVHNCRYGLATRVPLPIEPTPWKDPWQQGHDQNALIPFEDQTASHDIGGGGISTWGF